MNYTAPPLSPIRLAVGTSFALIDQVPVLFSEGEQKLFELNDVAAFIWCSLQDAVSLEAICNHLIDRGLSSVDARKCLHNAIGQWLSAGLVVPRCSAADFAFVARVGRKPIEIRASDAQVCDHLRSLFVATAAPAGSAEETFTISRIGNGSIVTHNDRKVFRCSTNELAPTFKAHVVEQLLLVDHPHDVIFHAAAVTSRGRTMLISAPPGTGKSTLTIHLLHAGFGYATDDLVIMRSDGSIHGVPFAPTLKSGSWSLIDHLRPEIGRLPIHHRQDGQAARYLDVASDVETGAIRVDWIIFLERAHGYTAPALAELDELDTIKRIVGSSFATHGKLTSEGFRALKHMVSRTRAFVLRYAEAPDAIGELIELRDGKL